MVTVPPDIPVTTPVQEPTIAMLVLLLLQVQLLQLLRVVVPPVQICVFPVISQPAQQQCNALLSLTSPAESSATLIVPSRSRPAGL
jgi:hypothetical protein